MASRRASGVSLIEALVASVLVLAVLLPVITMIRSTRTITAAQDFHLMAHARAASLLEGLLVTDPAELRRNLTRPGGEDVRTHALTRRILQTELALGAAAGAAAGTTAGTPATAAAGTTAGATAGTPAPAGAGTPPVDQLAVGGVAPTQRVTISALDDGLLEMTIELRWKTPVDPAPADHRVVLTALLARPDFTEAR